MLKLHSREENVFSESFDDCQIRKQNSATSSAFWFGLDIFINFGSWVSLLFLLGFLPVLVLPFCGFSFLLFFLCLVIAFCLCMLCCVLSLVFDLPWWFFCLCFLFCFGFAFP